MSQGKDYNMPKVFAKKKKNTGKYSEIPEQLDQGVSFPVESL